MSRGLAVAVAVVLVACTSGPTGRFTVNRHDLAVRCDGGPGPTVVFEAAVGGDHSLWPIADRIKGKALACVYDRAGQGDSSVPDEPMTAETDVADLHALLATAGIPRPIIVLGHSYGAQIAWVEVAEHPDEVAGVLLIDATPPSGTNLLESVLNDKQRKQFHDAFVGLRNIDFLTSLDQAQTHYGVQPTAYVTIITASHSMRPWCDVKLPCEAMQKEALATADEFVADHPGTRAVLADTSHFVQDDDPDLVVREIDRMVDLVSQGSPSLSTAAASISPAASSMSAGTAADLFPEVSGWSLVDAPRLATDFGAAANTYVAGLGFVLVQAAALATPVKMGYTATVVAFVIEPGAGHAETELFQAIVDGVRGGMAIDPRPACDGQAVSLAAGEGEWIVGPWIGRPDGSFLIADGSSTGSARAIYADLQGFPEGCAYD